MCIYITWNIQLAIMKTYWKLALLGALGTGLYISRKTILELVRDADEYTHVVEDEKKEPLFKHNTLKIQQIFEKLKQEFEMRNAIIPQDIQDQIQHLTNEVKIESILRKYMSSLKEAKDVLYNR